MTDTAPILPFATFLGDKRGKCEWDGFSFCEVIDRAEQEIPPHTHEEAHFFLLLRGTYISSARGAASQVRGLPTLLLPESALMRGTRPSQSFDQGRILAVQTRAMKDTD